MPETNDDATKFAHSQDARDFLNTITQEAFADADYLDALFDEPQIANDLPHPSRRRTEPVTAPRKRHMRRSRASRSRSSAAFVFLILGLAVTLLGLLYVNTNSDNNEVAKCASSAAEITNFAGVSSTPSQKATEKEEAVGSLPSLSKQENASPVIGVELFPDDDLKNVAVPHNPTPPGSPSIEIQNTEAYRNLMAKAIRRLKKESKNHPRTPSLPGLPTIGNRIPKQAVKPIPTTAANAEAIVDSTLAAAPVASSTTSPKTKDTQRVDKTNDLTTSNVEKPTPAVTTEYVAKPIKISDAKIGDRAVGANPLGSEGLDENVFYEIPHYVYQLRFNDEDGSEWQVNLLRPYNWLAISPTRIRDGFDGRPLNDDDLLFDDYFPILPFPQSYYLDVWLESEEISFQGWANVAAVDQTITIKPGKGNLVTGTFKHLATEVYDLYIEGQEKPIGCTKTHPFWSVDRQEFVPVDELYQNERVQCLNGNVRRAIDLQRRPKPETVYNLEIFNEHVYCVTTDGILVHNHCHDIPKDAEKFLRYVSEDELKSMGYVRYWKKMKKGSTVFLPPRGLVLLEGTPKKNVAELWGKVDPQKLPSKKRDYSFKMTIYMDKRIREKLADWGSQIEECLAHDGTLAIPAKLLPAFNKLIIRISVTKLK